VAIGSIGGCLLTYISRCIIDRITRVKPQILEVSDREEDKLSAESKAVLTIMTAIGMGVLMFIAVTDALEPVERNKCELLRNWHC